MFNEVEQHENYSGTGGTKYIFGILKYAFERGELIKKKSNEL